MSELPKVVRCAIYTRKSTEEGLEQKFNTLQAQREAAEAYIFSQKQNGWRTLADSYDDGGSAEPAWTVRHCNNCCEISRPAESTAW
jgi:DNA invertase Pin-like site-specific DNA recombinase